MEPARSLRDVFAGLAGQDGAGASAPDPRAVLAGYDDLPDDLLVTAIGSYADTAPAEVAEHLAGFVTEPGADAESGLGLLARAPIGTWDGEVELPGTDDGTLDDHSLTDDGLDDAGGLDAGTVLADGADLRDVADLDGTEEHDGTYPDDGTEGDDGTDLDEGSELDNETDLDSRTDLHDGPDLGGHDVDTGHDDGHDVDTGHDGGLDDGGLDVHFGTPALEAVDQLLDDIDDGPDDLDHFHS